LELLLVLFEFLGHLVDLLFTVDDVNKLGVMHLLLHLLIVWKHFALLLFHFLLLFEDLCNDNLFLFLLFVVTVPEFALNAVKLLSSELEELSGCNLLFFVEIPAKLKLLLYVADGIFDIFHVIFNLGDLDLGEVLQHLNVMRGAAMVIETARAEGLTV